MGTEFGVRFFRFVLGCKHLLPGLLGLRLQLQTNAGQLITGGSGRLTPQPSDGLRRDGFEVLWQVRVIDLDASLGSQLIPKPGQRFRRRAHGAFADVLVELVGGGRDAVSKEQQGADLAVQGLGVAEAALESLDFGQDLIFRAHELIVQRSTLIYKSFCSCF